MSSTDVNELTHRYICKILDQCLEKVTRDVLTVHNILTFHAYPYEAREYDSLNLRQLASVTILSARPDDM